MYAVKMLFYVSPLGESSRPLLASGWWGWSHPHPQFQANFLNVKLIRLETFWYLDIHISTKIVKDFILKNDRFGSQPNICQWLSFEDHKRVFFFFWLVKRNLLLFFKNGIKRLNGLKTQRQSPLKTQTMPTKKDQRKETPKPKLPKHLQTLKPNLETQTVEKITEALDTTFDKNKSSTIYNFMIIEIVFLSHFYG